MSKKIHKFIIENLALCIFLFAVFTGFSQTFLQRAQIVNTDTFLLIGWLGYMLYYPRFGLSLFFLFIGVFCKSLLGFYPAIIMAAYEFFRFITKKINKK